MARGRGRNFVRAASSWDWLLQQFMASNVTAGTPLGFEMATVAADFDETLFRTQYWLKCVRATDTTAFASVAWGIIVSTERSFAAATFPLPVADSQLEWIARGILNVGAHVAAMENTSITVGDVADGMVKSRRRLNSGENILLVFESLAGGALVQVSGGLSFLSKVSGT